MVLACDFDCQLFDRYRVDLPYPSVSELRKNDVYANIISGAYAGKGSETTAIVQYASHRYFTQEYPQIHTAYKYIAFVEMTHFDLLGNLILNLGSNPKLYSYETSCYWNGSYAAYKWTIKSILEADIEGEYAAVAHYTKMIRLIPNESIQTLFRRIILDEERHIEVLSHYLKMI